MINDYKGLKMKLVILFVTLMVYSIYVHAEDAVKADIVTQEIEYHVEDVKLTGYMAYDAAMKGKRPGVLVVHEWWGHNQYARNRAEMLAELGYVAFAVDMYGDGKLAQHPDDAGKFMREVTSNIPLAEKRMSAALEVLNQQAVTDATKTAAIGYCFGGGMVLHLARIGTDIDGVVSFHGSLNTESPAQKDHVKARVLVLHGEEDPFIPHEQVETFKQEMQNAGVQYEFVAYPDVKHSFTNPRADEFSEKFGLPALQYDQHADQDSWDRMQAFFDNIFN